ncbi:hypothetical protein BSNK01_23580 [Bacillaceae bacterium]
MGQRNILAGFQTREQAEKAAFALHRMGITETQVDRIDPFPGDGSERIMNPITGNVNSLAGLTLDAGIDSRSAGILLSADPSASGMADGTDFSLDGGRNFLLTVVTDDEHAAKAEEIIRQLGGDF